MGAGATADPDAYREMFRPLLPLDALPSAALSDRQLEVNCAGMLEGLRAVHAAEVAPCTRSRLSVQRSSRYLAKATIERLTPPQR